MSNYCNLSFKAVEWLNGELLGDGGLSSRSPNSARYLHASKHLEYCEYVRDTLKSFGIQQSGSIHQYEHPKVYFQYVSLTYVQLRPLYMEWYPEGKKEVPRSVQLTPLTCRQWYIGDGSLSHPQDSKPYIRLATCAFPVADVEWLIVQLQERGFLVTRLASNNTIRISVYSTKDFLRYIGDCPVECHKYKWKKGGEK